MSNVQTLPTPVEMAKMVDDHIARIIKERNALREKTERLTRCLRTIASGGANIDSVFSLLDAMEYAQSGLETETKIA